MANEWTPTQAAAWIRQVWSKDINLAAYDEAVIWPHAKELGMIEGQLNFRKMTNLGRTRVTSNSTTLNSLTMSGTTESNTTATPLLIYCALEVNFNTLARMMNDPKSAFRRGVELSLAEGVDAELASLASSFSTSVIGGPTTNISFANAASVIEAFSINAKMYYKPGKTEGVVILHSVQAGDLVQVSQLSEWQFRGNAGEAPVVSGWVVRGAGHYWYDTNVITESGTTNDTDYKRCMALIPDLTIGIGFNQKPTVKSEDFLLVTRIIGWTDLAVMLCWEQYGAMVKTKRY
jgi:hypothetical protein